jgi:hypothetical protein
MTFMILRGSLKISLDKGGHCLLKKNITCWLQQGRLAQLVEQLTLNQRVKGSNPLAPTKKTLGFRGTS